MSMIDFISQTVFHIASVISILVFLLLPFIPKFSEHFKLVIKIICVSIIVFTSYLQGSIDKNEEWNKKMIELQLQAYERAIESEKINRELEYQLSQNKEKIKVVTKVHVERIEVLSSQINNECYIQPGVIDVLNSAAEGIK